MESHLRANFTRYLKSLATEVFMKDAEGRYIFINSNHPDWVKPGVNAIGKLDEEVQVDENMARQCREEDLEILSTGKTIKSMSKSILDGKDVYYEVVKAPVFDDDGNVIGISGIAVDVTERVRLEQKALQYYQKDALTGLYNRNYLSKWKCGTNMVLPLSILVLDCNHLKKVNDTYGHKAGDEMLGMVAAAIEANIGEADIPFRVGGDEFCIMCNGRDIDGAKELAGRLHEELDGLQLHGVPLSAAIGYACMSDESQSIHQVYVEADNMMYENKKKYHEQWSKRQGE